MDRLLVTGATGFLGAPTVRRAAPHFEVHAAGRTARGPLPPGVRFHPSDLLAPGGPAALVAAVRPTHLIHLAWVVTPGTVWTTPENHRWADASRALLLAFARGGGRRAVLAGTCAEYDWSAAAGPCREFDTPLRPHTTYGRAKLQLARWAEALARARGVSLAWARLFFLYGPGEHPDRLVPSVARALLAGQPARCTAGTQERDFLCAGDAAAALVALARSDRAGPFNVGSGRAVAVREVIARVAALCGRPDLVRLGARPGAAGDPPGLVADVSRLRSLGWAPETDLGAGLARAVEWWRRAAAA